MKGLLIAGLMLLLIPAAGYCQNTVVAASSMDGEKGFIELDDLSPDKGPGESGSALER